MSNPNHKILPTPGRIVWFFDAKRHPGFHQHDKNPEGPYAAQIASVRDEDTVTLAVLDALGTFHGRVDVFLSHEGGPPPAGPWCEWMPYQKGQAAKTEAVEKELREVSGSAAPLVLPVLAPKESSFDRLAKAMGLPSQRVTPADVEAEIESVHFFTGLDGVMGTLAADGVLPTAYEMVNGAPKGMGMLTFCVIVLRNNAKVVGINYGAIDPAQHSAGRGREEAHKQAIDKVHELLGFRLRDKLQERAQFAAGPMTGEQLTARRTTFEDLVRHGLAQCMAEGRESNIQNGMPWSFTYKDMPVTHENDDCYIVGDLRFERGQVLETAPGEKPRVVPGAVTA